MNITKIQNKFLELTLKSDFSVFADDIIASVPFDLQNGEFVNGFLVFTKSSFFKAVSKSAPSKNLDDGMDTKAMKFEITKFSFSDYESLEVENNVAGGYSVLKDKGEKTQRISSYSARYLGANRAAARVFKKLKEDKFPDKEDFKDESNHNYCKKCRIYYNKTDTKCPKCIKKGALFLRTFAYFKNYKYVYILIALCGLLASLMNAISPYLTGEALYNGVLSRDPSFAERFGFHVTDYFVFLIYLVIIIVITKIISQIFGIFQGVMAAKIVPSVAGGLRESVFGKLSKLSVKFFTSKQTGSLMNRVLGDSDQIMGFFIDGVPYLITNVLVVAFSFTMMFMLNIRLALYTILVLPVFIFLGAFLGKRCWAFMHAIWAMYRKMSGQVNENITGARVVRAFGQKEPEINRFAKLSKKIEHGEIRVIHNFNLFETLYYAISRFMALLIWFVGAMMIIKDKSIDFGVLMTFTGYAAMLNGPFDFFSYVFRWAAGSMTAAARLFEIIDTAEDIKEAETPVVLKDVVGEVSLEDVCFSYEPGKEVLKNITIKIEPKQTLGIVGKSGVGKTTLANLIARLYDADSGEIFIDGVNVKDLSFDTLRKTVALVSQDTTIFMGTIAQNIAYAKPDAEPFDIINAAKLAAAHDFICKLPDGYDTIVGAGGSGLSGGERQRISIARAILLDAPVLILDEATSAVDTKTELSINNSLARLSKGRTTISIAHRLSTLKDADILAAIENGEIKERGTHKELLKQKGIYCNLVEIQNKALNSISIEY